MLRVGLTGDLGSGKSTVAQMLAARGAIVFSSDEMARAMMQPGQQVYAAIVAHFGPSILAFNNTLDRRRLAALAFDPAHPRIEELNAIVHPAVINAQAEQIAALAHTNPHAIAVVESALIFSTKHAPEGVGSTKHAPEGVGSTKHAPEGVGSTKHAPEGAQSSKPAPGGGWRGRFDRILMVTAPDHEKIARFVQRIAANRELSCEERLSLEADARRRLALQHTADHATECVVIQNDGNIAQLEQQVETAWRELQAMEAAH